MHHLLTLTAPVPHHTTPHHPSCHGQHRAHLVPSHSVTHVARKGGAWCWSLPKHRSTHKHMLGGERKGGLEAAGSSAGTGCCRAAAEEKDEKLKF